MATTAATLELILSRIQITKYVKAASITILFYDYLLTLESEISLIWLSPWGLGKFLYFLARYSAMVDTPWAMYESTAVGISPERCHQIYVPSIWWAVIGLASAEALLFLRTSALYSNLRKITIFVVLLWSLSLVVCIIIVSIWLRSVTFGKAPIWWQGCYQTGGSKLIYGSYVTLLLQETIIVILTIYRAIKTGVHTNDRLVKTLYRDGLLYFIYLLFIAIGNIIILGIGPLALVELLAPFLRVMHATLSSRVLLHARGAADIRHKEATMTDIRFAMTTIDGGMPGPSIGHVDVARMHQSGSDQSDEKTATASSVTR